MKTIIAYMPSRFLSPTLIYGASKETFECKDDGQWSTVDHRGTVKLSRDEVIAECRKATNWEEIKSEYFSEQTK